MTCRIADLLERCSIAPIRRLLIELASDARLIGAVAEPPRATCSGDRKRTRALRREYRGDCSCLRLCIASVATGLRPCGTLTGNRASRTISPCAAALRGLGYAMK